ncbi:phosphatase [Photobacterium satsumensis]|uniref:phosphatase n=1 Tax=Photobacterium satsumensis TaxID=2910239 RepID=UPI003D10FF51
MKFVVDTHSHTVSSGHAYSTVLENAAAAAEKGLQLLCVTDHASSMPGAPHFWHFANQKILPRFLHGVGILRGVEANIMNAAGEIDISAKVEGHLDWILASFHEPVFAPSTSEVHTQVLLNVIHSGRVDALGHLGNPNFDFDFERVLAAAAEANVLVEINNSSLSGSRIGSQPRCERIAEIGKEVGVTFTTGSDAHFAYDVGKFDSALALFEKVKVDESSVVTTSASRFTDFLESRGHAPIAEFQSLR